MSATEIEKAVQSLPPEDLQRFTEWFETFIDSQWEKRLHADVIAGRLDNVARKADEDFESGRCSAL